MRHSAFYVVTIVTLVTAFTTFTIVTTVTALMRWDLFCAVVDNLGDIGVCWRMARQLADGAGRPGAAVGG